MKVTTSAGELLITAHPQGEHLASVFGKLETLQALLDGIEMSYAVDEGEELEKLPHIYPHHVTEGHGTLSPSKRQLALWIQFEILNFL